jgi:peptidyl-prolyl cis-trans isomerase A (cyclophilin A)
MRKLLTIVFAGLLLSGCIKNPPPENVDLTATPSATAVTSPTPSQKLPNQNTMPKQATNSALPQSAIIQTSMGDIAIKFFPQTPITVANFVALATGTVDWTNPNTGQSMKGTPLYSNTIFHRVIPGFMIQGGDPLGTGIGGPGYKFQDEISPDLGFDRPYLLAMANSGPATNGSQFFITVAPTTWLNGKHTIFGEVTSGQDVVDKIAASPTGANDKPVTNIVITQILINP